MAFTDAQRQRRTQELLANAAEHAEAMGAHDTAKELWGQAFTAQGVAATEHSLLPPTEPEPQEPQE